MPRNAELANDEDIEGSIESSGDTDGYRYAAAWKGEHQRIGSVPAGIEEDPAEGVSGSVSIPEWSYAVHHAPCTPPPTLPGGDHARS